MNNSRNRSGRGPITPAAASTVKPAPQANRNAPKWISPNHVPDAAKAPGRCTQKRTAEVTASNAPSLRLTANIADVERNQFSTDHAIAVIKSNANQSLAASATDT